MDTENVDGNRAGRNACDRGQTNVNSMQSISGWTSGPPDERE